MIAFYVKLTKARIDGGMEKEIALAKVPAKYREAVREVLKDDDPDGG